MIRQEYAPSLSIETLREQLDGVLHLVGAHPMPPMSLERWAAQHALLQPTGRADLSQFVVNH